MAQKKTDIEQLLKNGHAIRIHPQGFSMYPLFVPGRDEAVIMPVSPMDKRLRRGAVVLYRREGGILVLHRIWKVDKGGIYLVGDNQTEIEGPLKSEQMRGILTGFIRNGKEYSVRHPGYQLYAHIWLFLRPFRKNIANIIHFIRKNLK